MAITDAYATAAEYRAIIDKKDPGGDDAILLDLKAVSRHIDKITGQFFTNDVNPVAREYRVPGSRGTPPPLNWAESENPWRHSHYSRTLHVDPISTTTGLIIKIDDDQDGLYTDQTALAATNYQLLPLNATVGPEPRPYTAIYVPNWSTIGGFRAGDMVQVTARFGWPTLPGGIKRACAHLTGILRLETPRATNRITEIGEQLSASREAQSILKDLIRDYKRTMSYV